MAAWKPKPTDPIRANEHLGRRLFDEPMLVGAMEQRSFAGIELRHFEETREDGEFSLDRVGQSSVDRKVVNYLRPRAVAAGEGFKPTRAFNGWAVLRAATLCQPEHRLTNPVASPIGGQELEENIYHSHTQIPEGFDRHLFALKMRHLFTTKGKVVDTHGKDVESPVSLAVRKDSVLRMCLRHCKRFLFGETVD
jgi:hypothetical protein